MKTPSILSAAILAFTVSSVLGEEKKPDPFETGMRQAFENYKKGDTEAVTAKLRELLKMMEEKGARKVGELLPESIGEWKGESLKNDDLGVLGGGVSISRNYVFGKRGIVVKVVKDSPLVKQLIPLLTNDELIRLSNRKTYRVSGETAIMDGERKLQMVVDGRILVELLGNDDSEEKDLATLVRKLDLNALAKIK